MADPKVLTPLELVLLLVKHADLHEGIWGLHVEFAFGAGNTTGPHSKEDIVPAAYAAITKIGIREYDGESAISVDASKVNPAKPLKKAKGLLSAASDK